MYDSFCILRAPHQSARGTRLPLLPHMAGEAKAGQAWAGNGRPCLSREMGLAVGFFVEILQ